MSFELNNTNEECINEEESFSYSPDRSQYFDDIVREEFCSDSECIPFQSELSQPVQNEKIDFFSPLNGDQPLLLQNNSMTEICRSPTFTPDRPLHSLSINVDICDSSVYTPSPSPPLTTEEEMRRIKSVEENMNTLYLNDDDFKEHPKEVKEQTNIEVKPKNLRYARSIKVIERLQKMIDNLWIQTQNSAFIQTYGGRDQLDATNIHRVLSYTMRMGCTLNNDQIDYIRNCVSTIGHYVNSNIKKYNLFQESIQSLQINTSTLQLFQSLLEEMSFFVQGIKEYVIHLNHYIDQLNKTKIDEILRYTPPPEQPENLDIGLFWLRDIYKIYEKYDGPLPTTPFKMMRWFKYKIHSLSDEDHNDLIYHIEYNLGNSTLKHISQNFQTFISQNWSCLPAYMRNNINL